MRELERLGYLERRRERGPGGHVRTRTYFYDVPGGEPGGNPNDQPPRPPNPRHPRKQPKQPATAQATTPSTATAATAPAPAPGEVTAQPQLADADPRAVAVLTALRRVDPRLVLSEREAVSLAPAVTQWLAAGVGPHRITELLTARLPDHFLARPARILAFRLRETPLPAPPPLTTPPAERLLAVLPFQTCDGCERAFRAPEPGRCRECRNRRPANRLRAAG